MIEKHDKPDDPGYTGGEDENGASHQADKGKKQQPRDLPVDESDDSPAAASHDPAATE